MNQFNKEFGVVISAVVITALVVGGMVYGINKNKTKKLEQQISEMQNQSQNQISKQLDAEKRLNLFYEQTANLGNNFTDVVETMIIFKKNFNKNDSSEIIKKALDRSNKIYENTVWNLNNGELFREDGDAIDIDILSRMKVPKEVNEFISPYLDEIKSKVNSDNREFEWELEEKNKNNVEEKMVKCGFIEQTYEGIEQIEAMPFYTSIVLKDTLNNETKDFLSLMDSWNKKKIMEDASLMVSHSYIANLFHQNDEFMEKYPNSLFKDELDSQFLVVWLTDNYGVISDDSGEFNRELLGELENFISKYPNSQYSPLFKSYTKFIRSKNLYLSFEDMKNFMENSEELKLLGMEDPYGNNSVD